MLNTILLILYFTNISVLLPQTGSSAVIFPEGGSSSKIEVSIFDNVIYVPISINNNSPVSFVLDTGAPEISIVESEITDKYKLNTKKGGDLSGAGKNKINFKFIENVKLSIDNIDIIDPLLGTLSLVHMEPYWGKPKHGILGGNILKALITEIDYINKSVKFYEPEKFSYPGMGKRIPVQIIDNSIYIKARIRQQGQEEVTEGKFIIDTAVRNTFINSPFTRKHQLIEKSKKIVENITGFGIGGVGFGKLSRLKSIELGGYIVNEPVVELTTDKKGIAASKNFDGIIGADILSRFTVILDYTRKEIILSPNKNFHNAFEYDKSGIYLILDSNETNLYKVVYVIKDSPAAKAGIAKGDIVLAVDTIPSQNLNYEKIKNYLKQKGKTVRLRILRNEQILEIDIQLAKQL